MIRFAQFAIVVDVCKGGILASVTPFVLGPRVRFREPLRLTGGQCWAPDRPTQAAGSKATAEATAAKSEGLEGKYAQPGFRDAFAEPPVPCLRKMQASEVMARSSRHARFAADPTEKDASWG